MAMPGDRERLYNHLYGKQLVSERDMNAHSAEVLFDIAARYFPISSVLDIGCGLGTWLAVAKKRGADVLGVEGPWCKVESLEVESELVLIQDLEEPLELDRKFDVAVSIEVGEHLSAAAAPKLVKALVSHSNHVIFSAAVPFQGGHGHVNEQFLTYWINLFSEHGYRPLDVFRGHIWSDESIHWWLWQNVMLFASDAAIEANPKLTAESLVVRPLDIIAPSIYQDRLLAAILQVRDMQESLLRKGRARIRETPQGPVFEII
jgi:SAM-dependent methyltransferase